MCIRDRSANIAFGVSLDKETVPVAGIRNIKAEDRKSTRLGLSLIHISILPSAASSLRLDY